MKSKAIQKFFVIYISFMAVMVLLMSLFIGLAHTHYKETVNNFTADTLAFGISRLETQLQNYQSAALTRYHNYNILKVGSYSQPFTSEETVSASEAISIFTQTVEYLPGKTDCGFILPNGMVLMPGRLIQSGDDMYQNFFSVKSKENYNEWFSSITASNEVYSFMPLDTISGTKIYNGITFIIRMPLNTRTNRNVFFFTISEDDLVKTLLSTNIISNGTVTVHDSGGHVLLERGKNPNASYAYVSAASKLFGLEVSVGIDNSMYRKEIDRFWNLSAKFSILFLFIGVILSIIFSYFSSNPVNKLVEAALRTKELANTLVGTTHQGKSLFKEYKFVLDVLSDSDAALKRVNRQLRLHEDQARFYIFWRLLEGDRGDLDVQNQFKQSFPVFTERFYLMIVEFYGKERVDLPESSLLKVVFSNILDRLLPEDAVEYYINGCIVIMAPANAGERERQEEIASHIKTGFEQNGIHAFCVAVGDIVDSISGASEAYMRLRYILRLSGQSKTGDIILQSQYSQYAIQESTQLEAIDSTRIYDLLLNGKQDELLEILESQLYSIKKAGHVEEQFIQYAFFAHVTACTRIQKILRGTSYDYKIPVYNNNSDVEALFESLKECTMNLCRQINDLRRSRECDYEREVMDFVREHVFDSELYVKMVTAHFNINDSALQRIVRNQTGKSFFAYIEQLRMDKANELLVNTDVPISSLINACGYSSMNSFYKAYKKRFGISPSMFRKTR